jgi:predicted enzyme related to lactoylglutathione lyase
VRPPIATPTDQGSVFFKLNHQFAREWAMERAVGIGGVFMRTKDPQALARWYRDQLGIDTYSEEADGVWWQEAGPTVWAPFPADTDYFGRPEQGWMINVRVRDLDAMRAQLRASGATVLENTEEMAGLGRFGWVQDPEGNRIELWEPAAEALIRPS